MSMLSERLQILISPEQRKRLEMEAGRRRASVATVVREAIDSHIGMPSRRERQQALSAIREMKGRYVSPGELEAIIDEERDRSVADR